MAKRTWHNWTKEERERERTERTSTRDRQRTLRELDESAKTVHDRALAARLVRAGLRPEDRCVVEQVVETFDGRVVGVKKKPGGS